MARSVPTRPADAASDAPAVGFDDRLLTDAVNRLHAGRSDAVDDREAVAQATRGGGDFEQRLVRWATLLPGADDIRPALARIGRFVQIAVIIALAAAAAAGIGATRGGLAIGRDETTNVFALLLVLLGVQSVVLLIWLVVMAARPRAMTSGSLGALVMAALSAAIRKWAAGHADAAAAGAYLAMHGRGPVARWMLSAISHGIWLSFNVAAMVTLLILLSTRQYTFVWETTILSAPAYEQITRSMARPLELIGAPMPTADQIAATRWPTSETDDASAAGARQAWSGFVLGSLVLYGLAPRAVLTCLSLWRFAAARRRITLPVTEPRYATLRDRLMIDHTSLGVVDGDDGAAGDTNALPRTGEDTEVETKPPGPPAVIGLELDSRSWSIPPGLDGQPWQVLGVIETGDDRRRIIEQLRAMPAEPTPLLVIAELPATPDRGMAATLTSLQRATPRRLRLLLTGGHRWRAAQGTASTERRVEDWRRLAEQAGVDPSHVIELDLDHLTDHSADRLSAFLRDTPSGESERSGDVNARPTGAPSASTPDASSINGPPGRRLEAAFDCIVDHARAWSAPPDGEAQTALYRDIARQYRDAQAKHGDGVERLRWFVPRGLDEAGDVRDWLGSAAARVTSVLPPSLKAQSAWLAAGATAGALGCLAASTLIWPAAVAALPAWSTIGAAVGGLTQYARGAGGADAQRDDAPDSEQTMDDDAERDADLSELIRGAALYAVLLELQGRDESTISRVLDRTFADLEILPLDNLPTIRRWLDDVRHRYDLALAREAGP